MRYMLFGFAILISIFSSLDSVHGAEHFGIQVYGGARLDAEETNFLKNVGANSYCYRTEDNANKVAAFYQKHPGLISLGGVNETGGMFVKEGKGYTVYIKVESPWQPSKGGELKKDTIIVITKE